MSMYFIIGAITASILLYNVPIDNMNLEKYLFSYTGIMIMWPILALLTAIEILLRVLYTVFTKNPIDIQ